MIRIEDVWYGGSPAGVAARTALGPASALFAAAAGIRAAAYRHGLWRVAVAPLPVVSVGALRVGGAGKTPFVLWLAGRFVERGLRPCLVTRGYGGRGSGQPRLLRAADIDAAAVDEVGDEAALLALRSGLPVVVGRHRGAACAFAHRELAGSAAPDLFLLDDGFQHLALARALDIVLVDGREPHERLLPAGPLREGATALRRAAVVVAMGHGAALPPLGAGQLGVRAEARASTLVASASDATGEDAARLSGLRVAAVAAIARPERFLADLQRLGARVVATVIRRDHHRYDGNDLREIAAAAANADLVVTTEKDLVKLAAARDLAPRLRALRVDVTVPDAEALLGRVAVAVTPPTFDR